LAQAKEDLPIRKFASQDAWRKWLAKNHSSSPGIYIQIAKKGSKITSIDVPDALEVALCYGWIDGKRKSLDENYFIQRFTPRTKKSKWSKINRDSASRLIKSGKMRAAGMKEVERAKADGRWAAAYDSPANVTVPPELAAEFKKNPKAKTFFETLNSTNRYAILYRIHDAKRPETRARRIEEFVRMLSAGEKLYP
jgi:uncharacterized protein YdeI (YjbR/CyaY-like superfamily)